MKIILISFYNRFEEYPTKYSLASLRLASIIIQLGNKVEIVPFNLDELDYEYERVYNYIIGVKPDIVGMSAYVWSWENARKIRLMFKTSSVKNFIIGGPEVQNRSIDGWIGNEIFVLGEGEAFWTNLLAECSNGKDFDQLSRADRIGNCERRSFYFSSHPLSSINTIPINSDEFINGIDNYRITTDFSWLETSRGCPYSCGYCAHKTRKGVFQFDLDTVEEEIKQIGNHHIRRVFIVDPIVGGTPKNGKEIFRLFRRYASNTRIIAYLRPEYLDDEYIKILANSNIEEIRIGIQTLTSAVPKWIRNNSINHIYNYLPALQENGIPWRAELIIGLPGDTYNDLERTLIDVVERIRPTFVYGYHLSVLKETPLWNLVNNTEQWISVDKNGISAFSSYSYSHSEMEKMLKLSDCVCENYNKNAIYNNGKAYNLTNSFNELTE